MQSIERSKFEFPALLFRGCLVITLLSACSSAAQEIYSDTLGVTPERDLSSDSPIDVKTAVNELAIKDPTARAALGREEVVPKDEKKKILSVSSKKSTGSFLKSAEDSSATTKKNSVFYKPTALDSPVKLNQLYFDNRYGAIEAASNSPSAGVMNARYVVTEPSRKKRLETTVSLPSFNKIELLAAKANQNITGGALPVYALPTGITLICLALGVAILGYKVELKRIQAVEKAELAKKNLWNKGLTEILPPR